MARRGDHARTVARVFLRHSLLHTAQLRFAVRGEATCENCECEETLILEQRGRQEDCFEGKSLCVNISADRSSRGKGYTVDGVTEVTHTLPCPAQYANTFC